MLRALFFASVAMLLAVAGCDRDERLVQQSTKAAVEESVPGRPAAKPPAAPPDDGVPSSSQASK